MIWRGYNCNADGDDGNSSYLATSNHVINEGEEGNVWCPRLMKPDCCVVSLRVPLSPLSAENLNLQNTVENRTPSAERKTLRMKRYLRPTTGRNSLYVARTRIASVEKLVNVSV